MFFLFRVFLFLGLVGMSYSLWMWIRNGVSKANIWNSALLKIFLGGVHFVPLLCGLCFVPITLTSRDHGGNVFSTAWTFSRLSSIQCYHLVKHFPNVKSKTISMFSTDGEQRVRPKAASEGGNLLPSHQTHQSLWWHRRGCLWQGETIFLIEANCCSCYWKTGRRHDYDRLGHSLN